MTIITEMISQGAGMGKYKKHRNIIWGTVVKYSFHNIKIIKE